MNLYIYLLKSFTCWNHLWQIFHCLSLCIFIVLISRFPWLCKRAWCRFWVVKEIVVKSSCRLKINNIVHCPIVLFSLILIYFHNSWIWNDTVNFIKSVGISSPSKYCRWCHRQSPISSKVSWANWFTQYIKLLAILKLYIIFFLLKKMYPRCHCPFVGELSGCRVSF